MMALESSKCFGNLIEGGGDGVKLHFAQEPTSGGSRLEASTRKLRVRA